MAKYGTAVRLQENQLYTVTLKLKGEATTTSFTSRYNPLFSTVKLIRGDYKGLFSRYTDDEINRLIHDNSKLAIQLAIESINPDFDDTTDAADIPYYAKQYVRYKTEFDLLSDIVYTLMTEGGAQEKLLADMKITKELNTRDLDKLLDRARLNLAPWESQVVGMRTRPQGAIRAGNTTYPLNQRRF